MDASVDHDKLRAAGGPGRFSRVSVQSVTGEIEAKLSDLGTWELRVRRSHEGQWRIACSGDLDQGAIATQPATEDALVRGVIEIHPGSRQVLVHGEEVALAAKEFGILLTLAAQPGRVFSTSELLAAVWGYGHDTMVATLSSHASKLRCKLARAGANGMIVNCRGVGYRFWDRGDLIAFPALPAGGQVGRPAPGI